MSVSVSVVVVSRDRPDALYLCVLGLLLMTKRSQRILRCYRAFR